MYFLVLEALKPKIKVLVDTGSGEELFPGSEMAIFTLYSLTVEGVGRFAKAIF